jgi:TetR/AcrR family transcriptional regulator
MTPVRKSTSAPPTRDAVFAAAATLFSARGFDGVSMDDIARDAGVNKAMIYYHFADKLALYRTIIGDGLQTMSGIVGGIVASDISPPGKLDRFIEAFVRMTELRPWMPTMMLREVAEGAPRLDADRLVHMRGIVGGFAAILKQGQDSGAFRPVHPILAYESVIGPIIINAARERVASQAFRQTKDFPLLVSISHDDVIAHGQETARRMLEPRATDLSAVARSAKVEGTESSDL